MVGFQYAHLNYQTLDIPLWLSQIDSDRMPTLKVEAIHNEQGPEFELEPSTPNFAIWSAEMIQT